VPHHRERASVGRPWSFARYGVLVVALVLVAFVPTAVAADGPNDPAPPGSGQFLESWALAPTGTDPSQPSSRPNWTYSLDGGGEAQDSASLWNYSDVQLTFQVYPTDAYNNRTGEFTLLPGDQKPKNAGTWVTMQTNFVTVPPRTRVDVPFTVHVPKDASPGDHTAGIVASAPTGTTTSGGQTAVVDRRTGSRVYVRVSGPVNPALVVENLSTDYQGSANPADGSLDVSYSVRNTGNVRLGARQQLEITSIIGTTIESRKGKLIQEVLPGNEVRLHERFTGVPAALRLGAKVKLIPIEPVGVTDRAPAPETYTQHAWAIPWTVLLLLVLAFLVWRIYRRYRDSRQGSPPVAPGGTAGGGGAGPRPAPAGASQQAQPVMQYRPPRPGDAPV
jgi:hypothetical protein